MVIWPNYGHYINVYILNYKSQHTVQYRRKINGRMS
jgi:hypothetical protein